MVPHAQLGKNKDILTLPAKKIKQHNLKPRPKPIITGESKKSEKIFSIFTAPIVR